MSKRRKPSRKKSPRRLGVIGVGRVLLRDFLRAASLDVEPGDDLRGADEGAGVVRATYRERQRADWKGPGKLARGKTRYQVDRDRAFVQWTTRVHEGSLLGQGGRDLDAFEVSAQWAEAGEGFLHLGESVEEYIGPDAFAFGIQLGTRVLMLDEDGDEESGEWLDLEWMSLVSTETNLDVVRKKLGAVESLTQVGAGLARLLKSAAGQIYVERVAIYVTAKHAPAQERTKKARNRARAEAARKRRAREKAAKLAKRRAAAKAAKSKARKGRAVKRGKRYEGKQKRKRKLAARGTRKGSGKRKRARGAVGARVPRRAGRRD